MPPVPQGVMPQQRGPSMFDKIKMGALMGGTVGSIMGFIYGTVTIFQYGAGTAGVMRTLGKYMLASGSMFGLFMGVGSIIRSDSGAPLHMAPQLWLRAQSSPILVQARRRPHDDGHTTTATRRWPGGREMARKTRNSPEDKK